jgi:hypothetical protein
LQQGKIGHAGERMGDDCPIGRSEVQLMPKPTSRRTSLQPVFEPFELLESAPIMPPLQTNCYHSGTLADEENSPFNGYDGAENGDAINGAAINDERANGVVINGAVVNGSVVNGPVVNGETHINGILNGTPAIALNGAANHHGMDLFAEEFDADPEMLAELAAAKAAFSAVPVSAVPVSPAPVSVAPKPVTSISVRPVAEAPVLIASLSEAPSINIASQHDTASQNGNVSQNDTANSNGDVNRNGHVESFSAAVAAPTDSSPEILAPPSISAAPPVIADEPVQLTAEPVIEASSLDASSPVASPSAATREPHPASGSLFVPYLVTEIRELRDRRNRRRSWWRRIFG